MEAKDSQIATIDANQQTNWLKAGCAYQMVATLEWKEAAGKISRKDIINASPEIRAIILAATIIHNPNSAEICRMILVANENDKVDNFKHYSEVLWLLHAQTSDPIVRARIVLALGIVPLKHVAKLYEKEFVYANSRKKNLLGHKEATDFSEACMGIIKQGAKESLLSKQTGPKEKVFPVITEVIDNFFFTTTPQSEELVLN